MVDTSKFHRLEKSEEKQNLGDEKHSVSFDDRNEYAYSNAEKIPLTPEELEKLVKEQCNETRQQLLQRLVD